MNREDVQIGMNVRCIDNDDGKAPTLVIGRHYVVKGMFGGDKPYLEIAGEGIGSNGRGWFLERFAPVEEEIIVKSRRMSAEYTIEMNGDQPQLKPPGRSFGPFTDELVARSYIRMCKFPIRVTEQEGIIGCSRRYETREEANRADFRGTINITEI